MKIFIKILSFMIIAIGFITNIAGISESSIAIVLGGGLFMTLGITIFVLNKNG